MEGAHAALDVFPSSLAAASRQRVERVEGPPLEGAHAALRPPLPPREYLYARRAKGGGHCAGEGRGWGGAGREGGVIGEIVSTISAAEQQQHQQQQSFHCLAAVVRHARRHVSQCLAAVVRHGDTSVIAWPQ